MVGLFDSGSGGLNTVRYIRNNAPDVDLVYLIDRERAPYGVKTEEELVDITAENIERLMNMGAERVLIACCTASTVHKLLPEELREVSLPIISEVAHRAKNSTRIGRVGVIATNHTVKSHAFRDALSGCEVLELPLGELVEMIDSGLSDQTAKESDIEILEGMLKPVLTANTDTLLLGCTHFPALLRTVRKISKPYGIKAVIDSAGVGAELLVAEARKLKCK